MLKAIFLDYNGTIVINGGPDMQEAVSRIVRGSSLCSVQDFLHIWWQLIREGEEISNSGSFVTEEENTKRALKYLVEHYALKENLDELFLLIQQFWSRAPVFSDVKPFFEHCPWPIYVISNNGANYISKRMVSAGLYPAGMICGEMVQSYKPAPDIYLHALKTSQCRPDQVIHIGDSLKSDYNAAGALGIQTILLDREQRYAGAGYRSAESLTAILKQLLQEKTYTVQEIIEPDYGCEGIPEGELPRCRLLLTDSTGNRLVATELDALLYERNIDEGTKVILSDALGILPAEI